MAWERSFEARVIKVREKELKFQKLNYTIEARSLLLRAAAAHTLTGECVYVGSVERHLERVPDARHLGGLLALRRRAQGDSDTRHGFHIRKSSIPVPLITLY